MPLCSSQRRTPDAASSPKALPPASSTPWMRSVTCSGFSSSSSSVPDAEPRTSTPPTAPPGHRMAVQPVSPSKSDTWPTKIPATSVSPFVCMRLAASRLYGSIGFTGGARLLDLLRAPVEAVQDFIVLSGRALKNVVRPPHYMDDVMLQMEIIGVGSLPIVILIGFFTGLVITMQMSRALSTYGAVSQVGPIVMLTLVRELGPVLTSVLVAGRNASGIASELGSMKVTEQIDAM